MDEELRARATELERQGSALAVREQLLVRQVDKLRASGRAVGLARKTLRQEQALLAQARAALAGRGERAETELEVTRAEGDRLRGQLPELEQRAEKALVKLSQARAQLREHLSELHAYARQSHEDIEAMRGQLQIENEQLHQRSLALNRAREEHRLAVAAFRQQLIEWQGQVVEMKRSLAEGESQLERRQAEVDEQARQIHASSARLAQQAELLEQQEIDVAQRRQEMEQHLDDMRQWYRQKLRQLSQRRKAEEEVASTETAAGASVAEVGMSEAPRNILQITGGVDPGDGKLGELLRSLALVDAQTLTALLLEARRQRRSLRQVLLAGGYLTLYQMALIEAGNLDGLVLGRLRVVDRLATNEHESLFRVYDPVRSHEVLLRHLAEKEMEDSARPEEFRRRFAQAAGVSEPHVAATFEVLEIAGRPAATQEWLVGLPSTDWTPLAAAPGVWYRLLRQAAQGLCIVHRSGLVHGHLKASSFTVTSDGTLKLSGLGEPGWLLSPAERMEEGPDQTTDLWSLGQVAELWWALSARRKGARPKALPKPLQVILNRLVAKKPSQRFGDSQMLLEELERCAESVPANAEAWDRFLLHVREHATEGAGLRQSA
jgi:hypothetical protein